MRVHYYILIFVIFCSSCVSNKLRSFYKKNQNYEIVKTELVVDKDTVKVSELRFYKLPSAKDGKLIMYQNFGKWDKETTGKYQTNVTQSIWYNVTLLEGYAPFTVVADGTETATDYFASLLVYDANNKNVFDEAHPLRERILNYFIDEMIRVKRRVKIYKLL